MKVWLIVAAAVAGSAMYYLGSCWLWPFRKCWVCDGTSKHSRRDRKVHRPCRWCRGSGRRLRIGRRIWNHFRGKQEAARS
jgi:hypothetical protein